MLTEVQAEEIIRACRSRMQVQLGTDFTTTRGGLKVKEQKAEVEFFAGAIAAIHAMRPANADPAQLWGVPPGWAMSLMSGRSIVKP